MRRRVALGAAAVVLAAGLIAVPGTAQAAENTCPLGSLGQFLHLPGCEDGGSTPTPTPSASPTRDPLLPVIPALPIPGLPSPEPPAVPGSPAPVDPAAPPEDVPAAEPDAGAPVFTSSPPVLSGSGLGLSGLSDIRIVEITRSDGSTARALRLSADEVVVEGFALDVPSGSGGLANRSERMVASGHVVVYADSIAGILSTNAEILIDTLSAPPAAADLTELTRIHIPLYGMTADRVVHEQSHQQIYG